MNFTDLLRPQKKEGNVFNITDSDFTPKRLHGFPRNLIGILIYVNFARPQMGQHRSHMGFWKYSLSSLFISVRSLSIFEFKNYLCIYFSFLNLKKAYVIKYFFSPMWLYHGLRYTFLIWNTHSAVVQLIRFAISGPGPLCLSFLKQF